MKNKYPIALFLGLIFISIDIFAQITPSIDKNYVLEYIPRKPYLTMPATFTPDDVMANITYLDGLGSPLFSAGVNAIPNKTKDIVNSYTFYDTYRRPSTNFLPFPSTSGNGVWTQATGGNTLYGDTKPYSLTSYENTALNRPSFMLGAGADWHTNNKNVSMTYEVASIIKIEGTLSSIVATTGVNINVSKSTTINEEGQQVREYKDNMDRVVRKEVQLNATEFATTVYVYDDFNRLMAVIQPNFFKFNTGAFILNIDTEAYNENVFAYEYDPRGRLTRKHIPGYVTASNTTAWEEYVYDKNDRVILSQNPRQAETSLWNFSLYDVFGRVVAKGESAFSGQTRSSLQTTLNGHTGLQYESRTSVAPFVSTNASTPASINAIITPAVDAINYYDSYTDINYSGLTFASSPGFPTNSLTDVKGMPVGSRVKNSETNDWIREMSYFDNTGNMIYNAKVESNSTAFSNISIQSNWLSYNFTNEVLEKRNEVTWKANSTAALQTTVISEANQYDHRSRKTKYFHNVNAPVLLRAEYLYDDIGRLTQKKLYDGSGGGGQDFIIRTTTPTQTQQLDQAPQYIQYEGEFVITPDVNSYTLAMPGPSLGGPGNVIQTVNYAYHVRGGIKAINGGLFSMNLDYQENGGYYDGNIKRQSWTINSQTRTYNYTYDKASRLLSGAYTGGNTAIGENYSLAGMAYDNNGNIKTMQRYGITAGTVAAPTAYGLIDDMAYTNLGTNTYSNRLLKVQDNITSNLADRGDFTDGSNGTNNDYLYYTDGSLKTDNNKGINTISYNRFNLTKTVTMGANTISYEYDGNGMKLKKKTTEGTETIYAGSLILEKTAGNLAIYQISHAEGRYTPTLNYEYTYADHLGNTRLMYNVQAGVATKTQTNAYDPWGLELSGINYQQGQINKYKFLAREKQLEIGYFDLYNRFYDPQIGRFIIIDPLPDVEEQESQGPFNYALNSPVLLSDPNGDCPICVLVILYGLMTAAQPVMAPSGGNNAKKEQEAYKNVYNQSGTDILTSLAPGVKQAKVSKTLFAVVKKKVKQEIKEEVDKAAANALNKQTQTNSKTMWKGKGKERIDVENANPTKRPGQVHYQDNNGNKYIYDASSGTFKNAPEKVNKMLKDPNFKNGIDKGLKYLE
jgi:RHS repeat-associated protein